MGLLDVEELCFGLLRALRQTIAAEWSALNELPADLPRTVSITEPPAPPEMHAAFARYGPENPLVRYHMETHDGRATRFSDLSERDLLNLARPYLIQAYRNALAHTELAHGAGRQIVVADLQRLGLTERQSQVLRLVAMGHSDQDVASALGIALRTAQKHLEHCYRTLEVSDRSQAARLAWAAAS